MNDDRKLWLTLAVLVAMLLAVEYLLLLAIAGLVASLADGLGI